MRRRDVWIVGNDRERRIVYDDIVIVDGDGSLPDALVTLLSHDRIDVELVRNVNSGCRSFLPAGRA